MCTPPPFILSVRLMFGMLEPWAAAHIQETAERKEKRGCDPGPCRRRIELWDVDCGGHALSAVPREVTSLTLWCVRCVCGFQETIDTCLSLRRSRDGGYTYK